MNKNLQKELDIKKWLESEQAQKDLCSTYSFCSKCDKSLENPCALAYTLFNQIQESCKCEEVKPAKKAKAPQLSFTEKLELAKDTTKEKYCLLCEALNEVGIKLTIFKKFVNLRKDKELIGKLSLTKNSLKLHLALDPDTYEEIPHLDYSDKKTYSDFPFTVKITSKKIIKLVANLYK
jgi:hypothetical protein